MIALVHYLFRWMDRVLNVDDVSIQTMVAESFVRAYSKLPSNHEVRLGTQRRLTEARTAYAADRARPHRKGGLEFRLLVQVLRRGEQITLIDRHFDGVTPFATREYVRSQVDWTNHPRPEGEDLVWNPLVLLDPDDRAAAVAALDAVTSGCGRGGE